MANWVSGDYNSCLRCLLNPSPIARHPVSATGVRRPMPRHLDGNALDGLDAVGARQTRSEGRSTTHSTSTTSTATLSFCFGEPTMTPSIGETSEKSRPMPRMM